MGEPAKLSPADRTRIRQLAREIVASVEEDFEMPEPFSHREYTTIAEARERADAFELALLQLAQLIIEQDENAVRMREYRFALEGIATDGSGNPVPARETRMRFGQDPDDEDFESPDRTAAEMEPSE